MKTLSENLARVCMPVNTTDHTDLKFSEHSPLFSQYEKAIVTEITKREDSPMEVTTHAPGVKREKSDPTKVERPDVARTNSAFDPEKAEVELSAKDREYNEEYSLEMQNVYSAYHELMTFMGADASINYTQTLDIVKKLQRKSIDVVKQRLQRQCVLRHDYNVPKPTTWNKTFLTYENAIFDCINQLNQISLAAEGEKKHKKAKLGGTTDDSKSHTSHQRSADISSDFITSDNLWNYDTLNQMEHIHDGRDGKHKNAKRSSAIKTSEAFHFVAPEKDNVFDFVKTEHNVSSCVFGDHWLFALCHKQLYFICIMQVNKVYLMYINN